MGVRDAADPNPTEAGHAAPTTTWSSQRPAVGSVDELMREFLTWVARCPRTQAEATEAWRSTCPRYTIWEDALEAELIRIERGVGMRFGDARVALTSRGRAALAGR